MAARLTRREFLSLRRGGVPAAPAAPPRPAAPEVPPRPAPEVPPWPAPAAPADGRRAAAIAQETCLAYRAIPCRACVDVCPTPLAIALVPGRAGYLPVIDRARCDGCGECVGYCPTDPPSLRVEI
jgi:ferredoxin